MREEVKRPIRSYTDLIAWQKAMSFVGEVYRRSERFPPREKFGLTAQVRRAAVSVPSNVAEGWGRQSTREYVRYLWISHGSLCEVETQLRIATSLNYLEGDTLQSLLVASAEVGRLLNALSAALEKRIA